MLENNSAKGADLIEDNDPGSFAKTLDAYVKEGYHVVNAGVLHVENALYSRSYWAVVAKEN